MVAGICKVVDDLFYRFIRILFDRGTCSWRDSIFEKGHEGKFKSGIYAHHFGVFLL
jgi:hypothetical protein